jgi:PBP4 family serine-type D-alanyl-D-alanine carboxypeptidase
VNAGETAFVKPFPLDGYFALFNRISTGEENSATDIQIERIGSSESIQLRGNIPLKSAEFSRNVSVRFPTLYYLSALKKSWGDAGIDLSKTEIREAKNHKAEGASLLWTHQSPALSEIMKSLLKESSNLGAETLARTLGMELRGEGAFSKGKEVVEEELSKMGLDKSSYQFADASGLSRHNMVSVDTLLQVLRYMKKDGRFSYFYDALPIAGCDGTLANRMRGTAAAGNAHAKTGSLSNISAISGYVQTRDGEMLAFSIIANNFLAPRSKIESAQDSAIERLAKFSRK